MSSRKRLSIPEHIHEQVEQIVADFNRQAIKKPGCFYIPRYSGNYLYLDRNKYGRVEPIARLKYQGELDNWDFAIYKYSKERYDPDEWFFPGSEYVNGTIEGAMKAGLAAYPLPAYSTNLLGRVLSFLFGRKR